MSPIQQMFLGVGAVATKTYVDDVFSTFLYKGNNGSSPNTQSINNGIDLGTEGGFVWIKSRTNTYNHILQDTANGTGKWLQPNTTGGTTNTNQYITSFNTNGFSLGTDNDINNSSEDFASWSFRKAPGFCDIVTYTGNGADDRAISHSLGSAPGMIIVKALNDSSPWTVYHREIGATKYLYLNDNQGAATDEWWADTTPTASNFYVQGTRTNANTTTFVAYLFAGGESTTATARSVDFESSNSDWIYPTSSSSDFTMGTGDFTVECWCRLESTNEGGLFQISSGSQGFNNTKAGTIAIAANPHSSNDYEGSWDIYSGSGDTSSGKIGINLGVWYHAAYVRSSGISKLYINGIERISITDTTDYTGNRIAIGRAASNFFDGEISNLRVVKGTAVYTSTFRPPTEPLTNITNTKLLCLNNSSITGTSVSPSTLTGQAPLPTASTDSPFDDPAGFVFGDAGNENLIKCGSYIGNGDSSQPPEIELGWEPQWVMVKHTEGQDWIMVDSMRGMFVGETNMPHLRANGNHQEQDTAYYRIDISSGKGFRPYTTDNGLNEDGNKYVYIAIRRPDGLSGSFPSLGTNIFAMDTGSSNSVIPTFDSGFPVDFALLKRPAATSSFLAQSRLSGDNYLLTNGTQAEVSHSAFISWDSNLGWAKSWDNNRFSWMWKRGAGFDCVSYIPKNPTEGSGNEPIVHSLGVVPEMIWVKNRSDGGSNDQWAVYHKDLSSTPYNNALHLNESGSTSTISNQQYYWGQAFTSNVFYVYNGQGRTGNGNKKYLAMLFASANDSDGNPITKVGSYAGNATDSDHSSGTNTITFGFQPRMVIIKSYDANGEWVIFDTLRGWASGSGNTKRLRLNLTNAQNNENFGYPTSTGMVLTGNGSGLTNNNGDNYIYYAHA